MLEGVHHIAYVVNDMEDAIRIFRDVFGLPLSGRRVLEGQSSVEIATFQCGTTLIELMRPINHPQLMRFLEEHGPGLHHVAFAMGDISKGIDELRSKGVFAGTPFVPRRGGRSLTSTSRRAAWICCRAAIMVIILQRQVKRQCRAHPVRYSAGRARALHMGY